MKTLQHLGDLLIGVSPFLPIPVLYVSQVKTVSEPYAHFIRRPQSHLQVALEFATRYLLFA